MVDSIGHCINIISNNHTVFFELIDVVCNIRFKSNMDIARTLSRFVLSLVSINSNYNHVIFMMLFRELMLLAPMDHPIEDVPVVGRRLVGC